MRLLLAPLLGVSVLSLAACGGGGDTTGPPSGGNSEPGRYIFWTGDARVLPLSLKLTSSDTEIGQITAASSGSAPSCGSAGAFTIDAPASGTTDIEVFNLPVFGNAVFTLSPTTGCKAIEVPFVPVELRIAVVGTGSGQVASGSRAIDCTIIDGRPSSSGCTSTRTLGTKFSLVATPSSGSTFVGYKDACPGIGAGAVCAITTKTGGTTLTVEFAATPVATVTLTLTPPSILLGQSGQASAVVKDAQGNTLTGRPVSWSSSDSTIASITAAGLFNAKKTGSVLITGSSEGKLGSAQLTVTAPQASCTSPLLSLGVGEIRTLTSSEKSAFCLSGGTPSSEYVIIPFNNSPVAVSTIALQVTGTNTLAPSQLRISGQLSVRNFESSLGSTSSDRSGEWAFMEQEYRDLSPVFAALRASTPRTSQQLTPAYITGIPATPAVGAVYPLNANLSGSTCSAKQLHGARVVAVLPHVIVLSDTLSPTGGYTTAEMTAFGQAFETSGYAVDTLNFGGPTDIDANGRVVVLFTPGVNLIPGAPGAFVAGLFSLRDLFSVTQCASSNEGEIFYMAVPDPNKTINSSYSDKTFLAKTVVATLAHEFQHLINAGRRIYVNNASGFEEVWLNEGLSHVAEELLYYRASGNSPRTNIGLTKIQSTQAQLDAFIAYQFGNISNVNSYMLAPESNSPYAQNDNLETRGPTWELLRYASDRKGGVERNTWFNLVNSQSFGQANFNAVFGDVVTMTRDWAVAQFADDVGFTVDAKYTNASWNFRTLLPPINAGSFPLSTHPLTTSPIGITLSGGAPSYIRFQVAGGTTAALTATSSGQPLPASVDVIVMRTK